MVILSTKPTFLHISYLNHIEEIRSKSCRDRFLILPFEYGCECKCYLEWQVFNIMNIIWNDTYCEPVLLIHVNTTIIFKTDGDMQIPTFWQGLWCSHASAVLAPGSHTLWVKNGLGIVKNVCNSRLKAKLLRSLEQFIQTVKGKHNFSNRMLS